MIKLSASRIAHRALRKLAAGWLPEGASIVGGGAQKAPAPAPTQARPQRAQATPPVTRPPVTRPAVKPPSAQPETVIDADGYRVLKSQQASVQQQQQQQQRPPAAPQEVANKYKSTADLLAQDTAASQKRQLSDLESAHYAKVPRQNDVMAQQMQQSNADQQGWSPVAAQTGQSQPEFSPRSVAEMEQAKQVQDFQGIDSSQRSKDVQEYLRLAGGGEPNLGYAQSARIQKDIAAPYSTPPTGATQNMSYSPTVGTALPRTAPVPQQQVTVNPLQR